MTAVQNTALHTGPLAPGTAAPDFSLRATPDQRVTLSELRGRPVILAFYPGDFSPVCSGQVGIYNEALPEFLRYNAQLLGISVDSVWCHRSFAEAKHLHFPLLADFEPKGEVARRFGVYRTADGTSERALFVLDANGIVRWSYRSPIAINPGADGILDALNALGGGSPDDESPGYDPAAAPAPAAHLGTAFKSGHLRVPVSGHDHAQGPADAPVTLVEYGDYECPTCAQAHTVVRSVQQALAKLGVPLRFVFRNFQMSQMHPHARHAAAAAESVAAHAGEPAFWAMHEAIYTHQQDGREALDDRHLAEYAAAAGADAAQVQRDVAADAHGARIDDDFLGGVRSGVNGTPTFFVNGERFDGEWTDVRGFVAALARAAGR